MMAPTGNAKQVVSMCFTVGPFENSMEIAAYYDVLRRTTTYYDVLQRTTTYHDVLRRTTTYYDVLRRSKTGCCGVAVAP